MTSTTPSRPATSGFTLTEIIVAAGIIAVLAGLLIPSLKNSIQSARSSQCTSNLRQISLALEAYAGENDQLYPKIYDGVTKHTTWMWDLAPYAGMATNSMGPTPLPRAAGIFVCPAYKPRGDRAVTYAYNTYIMPDTGWGWNYRKLSVPTPSKTILLAEIDKNADTFWPTAAEDVSRRHPNKSANYLFADGHVENIKEKIDPQDKRWKW